MCYVDPSGHSTIAVTAAGWALVGGTATGAIVIVGGAIIIVGGSYYVSEKIDNYVDSRTTYKKAATEKLSEGKDTSKITKKVNGGNKKPPKKNNKVEISKKALESIKKKWGQKGVDAFKKAMNKGKVGARGQNGIKQLKGRPIKGKYTHEIKVKNKEYGDYRIYGYLDETGSMIFDYFGKGLH